MSQVGYLGRRRSNIILEYAQEALESMAVNVGIAFGHNDYMKDAATVEKEISSLANRLPATSQNAETLNPEDRRMVVTKLAKELNLLKAESKDAVTGLNDAIKELEVKLANNTKYLPPLVRSGRLQVIHRNTKTLVYAHSALWKTICGWNYYGSSYEFAGECGMIVGPHSKKLPQSWDTGSDQPSVPANSTSVFAASRFLLHGNRLSLEPACRSFEFSISPTVILATTLAMAMITS